MQLFGGPHGTQHRGPPTTAGVCGWPVTWPPGAPVMAELDPQWHLSEKLLLQGSGVGSDGMGCGNGWANAAKKKTRGLSSKGLISLNRHRCLSSWIGDFSFGNIEAALVDREKNNPLLYYVTLFFIQGD